MDGDTDQRKCDTSDSQESEGEDLSIIRPTLIRELRNVLDLYPDDGQILKELIQNAEDAGASVVKILADKRSFNQELDQATVKRFPHLKFFKGPALCVYNDAEFTALDWEGIRMLHTSVKEKDPLKVGRFGLGFKSVFHLTDRLVIISGERIMYMDPFKGEDSYCNWRRVAGRKKKELRSILHSLGGVFGVGEETFREARGRFPGTLFWFPLRQSASDLSSTVYTEQSVQSLMASFRTEAPSLLLFLSHIQNVQLFTRDEACELREVFSIGIASSCLQTVCSERQRFTKDIASDKDGLPKKETYCITEVVIEIKDHIKSSTDAQRWLVASYHCGQREMSSALSKLCSDPQLSYRPSVGVAIPLTNQESFQSQVFCFLPLPLDTRSPTGLPVHVHGYFALEQNRRHLKWPPADQLRRITQLDPATQWNCLLVTELLPRVYGQAILRLQQLHSNDPGTFYRAWPDLSKIHDRWKPLLKPLYKFLVQQPVFFSHTRGGHWVPLLEAVLQRFSQRFRAEVDKSVVKVYAANNENLVELPEHVHNTLLKFCLLNNVKIIQAARVSQLIPSCLPQLDRSDKLCLLHYLCQHDKALLVGQTLLPLADGLQFGTFTRDKKHKSCLTFWCSEEIVQLFPGLEGEFCDSSVPDYVREDLRRLAESGILSMDKLEQRDPRIPALLQKSLQTRFGAGPPNVAIDDPWIQRVWQFLAPDDLSSFRQVHLLPMKKAGKLMLLPLAGVYVCSSVDGMASLSSDLISALIKLGVTVLHELPDYVVRHRRVFQNFVYYPSVEGVLTAVGHVNDDLALKENTIKSFNFNATGEEKTALIQLLSDIKDACRTKIPAIFRHLEIFTNAVTKQYSSIEQVGHISPIDLPPVVLPRALLTCNPLEKRVAISLGATEIFLKEVVQQILQHICTGISQYSKVDIIRFMTYFLQNKILMTDQSLLDMAKRVEFITTECGQLKMAADLYDSSSSVLQALFHSQQDILFPYGEFAQSKFMKKLKKLGLRTEKEVKKTDLIEVAKQASEMFEKKQSTAKKIAEGLWTYLEKYGGANVSKSALETISAIQCLPCLQDGEKPKDYPGSLPLNSSQTIEKPSKMGSFRLLSIVGSVVPMLKSEMSDKVVRLLHVAKEPRLEDVFEHLQNVIQHFQPEEVSKYRSILHDIFQHLRHYTFNSAFIQRLKQEKCVLVDSGECFTTPDSFWLERRKSDIDLKPYRFPVPVEMKEFTPLLEACGSTQYQNNQLLHSILAEVKSKYSLHKSGHADFSVDFQLVKHILDVLKASSTAHDGATLLPIIQDQVGVLRFKPARECTVLPVSGMSSALELCESELFYVHRDISPKTALDLGALLMKDRALTGVEDLDYEYGQHEKLTSRLHDLLKNSYTDGFSVPKELIQNADDACASKVWFLLDERENLTARTNLIAESMASLQGPAVWAYNDAVFSDEDFKNIVKLGTGTKKDDAAKVGRFGLGFNAVYNLTDVPCFISKHQMAMFDPQQKYLDKGAGLKLDFRKAINQDLLARMPEQFQPFQNVFGCTLQSQTQTLYNGTLFRFPLRTEEQADSSELKSESYTKEKRRQFLKMLLEKAGGLLMFTQSVREVQVFHLPSNCSSPTAAKCLLTVKKNCLQTVVIHPQVQLANKTILQFVKECWSKKKDIKIWQRIEIDMTVTEDAEVVCGVDTRMSITHWQLAWATSIHESATMSRFIRQERLVPLAAVAALLSKDGLQALRHSPPGFYNTGHLFCFLPLPEEMAHVTLPVHVNGTFALTSDRRGLEVQTEDDLDSRGSSWNSALYGDAVCRAYLLLLELVKKEAAMDDDFSRYFDLWPKTSVPCLVDSFYRRLESDGNTVLPVPNNALCVAFEDARFLQPQFRNKDCGKIAWDTLQRFWKGSGYLVDVPSAICELMAQKAPSKSFEAKVITELQFYRDFFFPNLLSDWWQPEHRDALIHHALMQNDKKLDELIKNSVCIPCEGSKRLRKPSELVSPKDQVAKLFLTSEGRFPQTVRKDQQGKENELKSKTVDFCDSKTLQHLSALGMMTNELPWELVLDRAQSVKHLNATKGMQKEFICQASNLIEYLSVIRPSSSAFAFENCPLEVKNSLSRTVFLPVLSKPEDWPFPWAGEKYSHCSLLASPVELVSDTLKHLVACNTSLLDTKALIGSVAFLSGKRRDVLKDLGLVVEKEFGNSKLLQFAMEQLTVISQQYNSSSGNNRELAQSISSEIYSFLTTCLKRDETGSIQAHIQRKLSCKDIVWTGVNFVRPSVVAFHCQYDCSPFLFQLERSFHGYKDFFKSVKVKPTFKATDILSVLEKVREENDGIQLSEDKISLVSRLAQLLGDTAKTEPLDTERVFLPDSRGFMQPACRLCVDDCQWLKESDFLKFVNENISPETARLLGVQSKKRQHFDTLTESILEPFGQSEKLTSRIRRLLQGYTFDSSLFKELMQNADDAGATECKLIMDFRQLGTETIPDNWEEMQGPALCFYNNKSFTKRDMQGIQNLGEGSKGHDTLKTGQFGVGFNAVFHITDVPSFWTREDDEKEVICVLDPNCQYVCKTETNKPGVKFTDMDRTRRAYPDLLSGYLHDVIDATQPGSLFRLPLRTDKMAEISEIKKEVVSESQIKVLLHTFQEEMSTCLLFLNNLKRVGIYCVKEDGSFEKEFEVNYKIKDSNIQQANNFRESLQTASCVMKQKGRSVKDIQTFEAVVQSKMKDSKDNTEDWLTVHRGGFADSTNLSPALLREWGKENFRLLPAGGVAVKLGDKMHTGKPSGKQTSDAQYQAFCMLPLPVYTGLPMHVNGHFALDHETRRDLWDGGKDTKDARSEWNSTVSQHIIVPAYIRALKRTKQILFPKDRQDLSSAEMTLKLKQFHDLFPQPDCKTSEFWKTLMYAVYQKLAKDELSLFPVVCLQHSVLEWVPAEKKGGFPGYFNNLETVCEEHKKEGSATKPVIFSQGRSSGAAAKMASEPTPAESAKHLKLLLGKLNMKILEAPFEVHNNFKASGVDSVQQVTPETVLTFLQSAGQNVQGGCNIRSLPQRITNTPLATADDLKILIDFLSKEANFLDSLDGLPLCLRQSEILHTFCSAEHTAKPIISEFSQLLPGSADEFLHKDIIKYFLGSDRVQAVLQKLTIPMLAERLRYTLRKPCFSAGEPFVFDQKVQSDKWIKLLWKFLETQLKQEDKSEQLKKNSACGQSNPNSFEQTKGKDQPAQMKGSGATEQLKTKKTNNVKEFRRKAEEELQSLREWCLIPVKKNDGSKETSMLYPIKYLHRVVYLSSSRDESNSCLWDILQKLPLPFLDALKIAPVSVANKLVASISHPKALLHALIACVDHFSTSHENGSTILHYFSNNLTLLEDSCADKAQLQRDLKSLPVFPAISGNVVSTAAPVPILCLESKVPHKGLTQWSKRRNQPVMLLRADFVPQALLKYLGFETVNTEDFYSQYLLPSLEILPLSEIVIHMDFLRENFFQSTCPVEDMNEKCKQLCCQLKSTAFIDVNGTLHRAQDFYTPHDPVFQVMCGPENFPPKPYCDRKWNGLMAAAGIASIVTEDMFLKFAHAVEKEGNNITEEVITKSETLVKHMFMREKLTERGLLVQARTVRFLLPSDWRSSSDEEQLTKIVQPFSPVRLVSYEESSFAHHLHLLWSSCCLLDKMCDPRNYGFKPKVLKMVMTQLRLEDKAPKDKVIQHTVNICQSLEGDKAHEVFVSMQNNKRLLISVLEALYSYLEDNTKDRDIVELKQLPIICDIENSRTLLPANVVMDLRPHEIIKGHIERAPEQFGRFFDFFKKLGAAPSVTADHYANVLFWLKTKSENEELNVEELKVVKTAAEGLFRCLREGTNDEQKRITTKVLYLPTEQKCLQKSTALIFKDTFLGERFKDPPEGKQFFLGFEKLEIRVNSASEEIKRLPKKHKILMLSEVVKEIVPQEIADNAEDASQSNLIATRLSHPFAKQAIVRLVYHQHKSSGNPFTKESAELVVQKLKGISVKEVFDLKTVLTMYGKIVLNTTSNKPSFTVEIAGEPRMAVVYMEDWRRNEEKCVHSLYNAVRFVLQTELDNYLLHRVLQSPDQALKLLDQERIPQFSLCSLMDEVVFPQAGTFIPVQQHCHLNNGFLEFYNGEHVGFEMFDPQIDNDDSQDFSAENMTEDPVIIYGIVIDEVRNSNTENTTQLTRHYTVDLGPGKGIHAVSVIKLYKIIRKMKASTSAGVVDVYQGNVSEGDEQPLEYKAVLREIRRLLNEAWHLPGKKDRRHVVKRLLLQWHPDKNSNNEEFCTRVTQAIFHYVNLLDQGLELPSDDADDDNNYDDSDVDGLFNRPESFFRPSFFRNMHARGHRHRSYDDWHSNSSRSDDRQAGGNDEDDDSPNPQPGEGWRWLLQAQADIMAAQAARGTCNRGHNWICYLSHQAAEKALKAVLFYRGSEDFNAESHDLQYLASHVSDSSLADLAEQFEGRVGPHKRMCYPDVLVYPRVPADLFSDEDAIWACDVADQIVRRVQSLIGARAD